MSWKGSRKSPKAGTVQKVPGISGENKSTSQLLFSDLLEMLRMKPAAEEPEVLRPGRTVM